MGGGVGRERRERRERSTVHASIGPCLKESLFVCSLESGLVGESSVHSDYSALPSKASLIQLVKLAVCQIVYFKVDFFREYHSI